MEIHMDEMIKRARRAYFRRFGAGAPQPNQDLCGIEHSGLNDPHDHVVLRNVRGELARYRITANGGLRYIASVEPS